MMFVLGVAGLITPLGIERGVLFDTALLIGGTLLFYLFARTGKRVSRLEGLTMFVIYILYMSWVIFL
jgi:cation:H+ antiporter